MERFSLDIPFNRPFMTGREFGYIADAFDGQQLSGNGPFGRLCGDWLRERTGAHAVFLTPSGTAALELAALAAGIGVGDEIIMPSFTFASTATAFALRGAVPVFVDIDPETLTLDPEATADALTPMTRAIVPVTYAGVTPDLGSLADLAQANDLLLVEDAAQGVGSSWRGKAAGSVGEFGALSFHETKNVTCGEGGALLVRSETAANVAEVMQEKGTDRARHFRGEIDRYTWRSLGSSYVLSEINAAFLWAQLEAADEILARRMSIWDAYHEGFRELEERHAVRRPQVPADRSHNAHLYYLLLPSRSERDLLIERLRERGIVALFHYVPLHSSPAGVRLGRTPGELPVTDRTSDRLVRLPLWVEMRAEDVNRVIDAVHDSLMPGG